MGTSSSSEKKKESVEPLESKNGSRRKGLAKGMHWSGRDNNNPEHSCPWCKKSVPRNKLAEHIFECPEKEVVCSNEWCKKVMRKGDLLEHKKKCDGMKKALCGKCGKEVLETDLSTHRTQCHPTICERCGELCITRIHKWCPRAPQNEVKMYGPFAVDALNQKYSNAEDLNVARMQLLWRTSKLKSLLEEVIFRRIGKEIDLKKEGFGILKDFQKKKEPTESQRKYSSEPYADRQMNSDSSVKWTFPENNYEKITLSHVKELIENLSKGHLLPRPRCAQLLKRACEKLTTLQNVVKLTPKAQTVGQSAYNNENSTVIVVGDLHGQLGDLHSIITDQGYPSDSNYYVFNGDFVDRGPCGVEIFLILISLFLACEGCVFLNRGNHECSYMNEEYGFDVETITKYDRNIYSLFCQCFNALPLATIINDKIFVVHAGLPRQRGVTIGDLQGIYRCREIPLPTECATETDVMFGDLLWSDPVSDIEDWRESSRGIGIEFGERITKDFLETNNLELVIRSHEDCPDGYMEFHSHKLYTVFSASNYTAADSNFGAVCLFMGSDKSPEFRLHKTAVVATLEEGVSNESFGSLNLATIGLEGSFGFPGATEAPNTEVSVMHYMRRPMKSTILREIRELIYRQRYRLLLHFSKIDRTRKSSVWIMEWAGGMRSVLHLGLPWYYLRSFLVPIKENRILYCPFIRGVKNAFQALWINDWSQEICEHLVKGIAESKSKKLVATSDVSAISFPEFCAILRELDRTISDAAVFQLFQLCDTNNTGLVERAELKKKFELASKSSTGTVKWNVNAVNELMNCIIQGRAQLGHIFQVTPTDRSLPEKKFSSGMEVISRGMRNRLTEEQRKQIYSYLKEVSPDGEVTLDNFSYLMYLLHEGVDTNIFISNIGVILSSPVIRNVSFFMPRTS